MHMGTQFPHRENALPWHKDNWIFMTQSNRRIVLAFFWGLVLSTGKFSESSELPNILFLIGDNWSYEHAGANGCSAVKTPVFDRIAREGMRFTNAFCPVPSCSPTRSCIVTGRMAHELEDAASLYSKFYAKFRLFTDLLQESGYHVGHMGKGWAPGNYLDYGRNESPCGKLYKDLEAFLEERDRDKPFFFWHGSMHTALHQFKKVDGSAVGIDPNQVRVPGYLPDDPLVRKEIADYLGAVQMMDAAFGESIATIDKLGELDNTVVVCLSDNGWQMPRGLANCHDSGTHVPLAVRWPGKIKPAIVSDAFIGLADLAPTFLEIAGLKPWPEMTARSFVDVLSGASDVAGRDCVFLERERHANVRRGDLGYPCRCIRTKDFLYIQNLRPERWPAGDPEYYHSVGPFGDIDSTRTKKWMMDNREDLKVSPFFHHCFEKRPSEELYELKTDPDQINNIAMHPNFTAIKSELKVKLSSWMSKTHDPRVDASTDIFDSYPYLGKPIRHDQ
jgi:N-sulfoglucosamine sulfohydrolase